VQPIEAIGYSELCHCISYWQRDVDHVKVKSDAIRVALFALANEGAVDGVLRAFQKVMETSLRQDSDFDLNEADYQDRLCSTLLQNAGVQPEMEFRVTKLSTSRTGLTDILIESQKVCVLLKLKKHPLEAPGTQKQKNPREGTGA